MGKQKSLSLCSRRKEERQSKWLLISLVGGGVEKDIPALRRSLKRMKRTIPTEASRRESGVALVF